MQTQSLSAPSRPAALVSVDGRTYPLESSRLEARAEGGMALSTLHQLFRNPHAEALEVVYTMPLPADGAVLGYTITVGERRIEGVVRSREEAAREYREALYQGRTAGLLEQERADTFTQTVGNIPGGTDVSVEIRVLHPLAFRPAEMEGVVLVDPSTFRHPHADADLMPEHAHPGVFEPSWEYRFPTVTGVRYMGTPGQVPDGGRLSPDRATQGLPARITVVLEVADLDDPSQVSSPSHPISSRPRGRREPGGAPGAGVVIAVEEGEALDRDIVIQWSAATPDVGVRLVEGGGLPGDEGRYALVTILPPTLPHTTVPRDVTVLLDTSGSMSGLPLELGKQVIQALLETLEGRDRFELLTFGSRVGRLTQGMVPASEANVARALERMHAEQAAGHTDMQAGVEAALRPLREDSQRQVVLVTDGYVGFENSVMASVLAGMSRGARFHAVGVGAAPNRSLTGGLARAGRGVELFALDLSTAFTAAAHLVAATRRPVLTDIRVTGNGVVHSAPTRPRDVLSGQPLVLTAELSPRGGSVVVEGVLAGRPGVWRHRVEVPAASRTVHEGAEALTTTLPVGAIHGRELIADLEMEEAAGADPQDILRHIETAGLRHRIVSRRTSLVAVSSTPTVDPRDPSRRETLAVELPAGVSAAGLGLLLRDEPTWGGGGAVASSAPLMMADMAFDFEGEAPADFRAAPPAPISPKRRGLQPPPRRKEAPRLESRVPTGGPPKGGEEVEGEVVLQTPERLVVEFQVPREGFLLPQGEVTVRLPDGRRITALVDPAGSTQVGPHRSGMRVRLALTASGGGGWPELDPDGPPWTVNIRWGAGAS